MRARLTASDAPVLGYTGNSAGSTWSSTKGMEMLFPVNRLHTAGTGFPITGVIDSRPAGLTTVASGKVLPDQVCEPARVQVHRWCRRRAFVGGRTRQRLSARVSQEPRGFILDVAHAKPLLDIAPPVGQYRMPPVSNRAGGLSTR